LIICHFNRRKTKFIRYAESWYSFTPVLQNFIRYAEVLRRACPDENREDLVL
jgi:hypothetical protein